MDEEFGIDQIKNWLDGLYAATDTIDDVIDDGKINWNDAIKVLGLQAIVDDFTGNPDLLDQITDLSPAEIDELTAYKNQLLEQSTSDEERDRATKVLDALLNLAFAALAGVSTVKGALVG